MFRITKDPSSGSLIQHVVSVCVCVVHSIGSPFLYSELYTRTTGRICCRNTDYVHVNGHDRTIIVILAKYCIRLPDPL